MNKDITLMIELQRYWDNVLRCRGDIEKSEKSILHWKDQLKAKSDEILALEGNIKNIKVSINEKETELSEKDEQIKKLEKRKDVIKNEKEVTALEHEFIKIKTDKDNLENELINLFDYLKQKEDELKVFKIESAESEKQSLLDIKELEDRINRFQVSISENQNKFDSNIDQLSAAVKTRFSKLIKSQNGKGIAIITGENCGVCNFQIPFNLIQDALKESNIVNCSNCGKFLYKI
jgi:predicted  nucleic acid-binding Zn-ribbon protein